MHRTCYGHWNSWTITRFDVPVNEHGFKSFLFKRSSFFIVISGAFQTQATNFVGHCLLKFRRDNSVQRAWIRHSCEAYPEILFHCHYIFKPRLLMILLLRFLRNVNAKWYKLNLVLYAENKSLCEDVVFKPSFQAFALSGIETMNSVLTERLSVF